MQDPKDIERARILTDLTNLAQSLVKLGCLNNDQPEILLVGKCLLMAIGAVQDQESAELLQQLITEYSTRDKNLKEEKEIRDLLSSLGIRPN